MASRSVVDQETGFDATYASRNTVRNARKVDAVVREAPQGQRLLDIGCNAGYVTRALLQAGKAREAIGVELDGSVVMPELMSSDAFTLFEGAVTDYPFDESVDITCYLAVHHHVIQRQGLLRAMELWRDIVRCTRQCIFFEIGQIAERKRHEWRRAIKQEYSDDGRLLRDLLLAVGPRLKGAKVIKWLPMHRGTRPILRIDLHPPESVDDPADAQFYRSDWCEQAQWQAERVWRRTHGWRAQALIEDGEEGDRKIYWRTEFCLLRHTETGEEVFAKRILDNPYKQRREYRIHEQLSHPRVVPVRGVHAEHGLMFPYLRWQPLGAVELSQIRNADEVVAQIERFFREACTLRIDLRELDYRLECSPPPRRLIDVVDLHPHNFLVDVRDGEIVDWKVVDLEYAGNGRYRRNRAHLAWILWMSRRSMRAKLRAKWAKLWYERMRWVRSLRRRALFTYDE